MKTLTLFQGILRGYERNSFPDKKTGEIVSYARLWLGQADSDSGGALVGERVEFMKLNPAAFESIDKAWIGRDVEVEATVWLGVSQSKPVPRVERVRLRRAVQAA